jgi:hypothetical protein
LPPDLQASPAESVAAPADPGTEAHAGTVRAPILQLFTLSDAGGGDSPNVGVKPMVVPGWRTPLLGESNGALIVACNVSVAPGPPLLNR